MHRTIVTPATLAARLDDPDWCIVDCRFSLGDPQAGRRAWAEGHIPGAIYAHLDDDLAALVGAETGRHPLPEVIEFARTLAQWGIGPDTQVVAYDDAGGAIAARLWWMLRWVGHPAAAVLDGGIGRWTREGRAVTTDVRRRPVARFHPKLRSDMICGAMSLARELENDQCILMDARAAARFLGQEEPLDARAGHIPGAVNHPFQASLDHDGSFLDPALLRQCFDAALAGHSPSQVVCMCGSGVTACHLLLAMAVAGYDGARLYPGSWSHWITDPARPVEKGPA